MTLMTRTTKTSWWPTMRVKKRRQRAPKEQKGEVQKAPGTGPDRFTVERFLHGIGDVVAKSLLQIALSSGYQIETRMIHPQMLPAILILACYSRYYEDVELVDDYDRLVDDYWTAVAEVAHSDKYLASCIRLLHARDAYPSLQAFEDVRVPDLYRQLVTVED